MKVAIKNFFRNKMVNLTVKSVERFTKPTEIHCFNFYKNSPSDYSEQPQLSKNIITHYYKTKYVNPENKSYDHEDSRMTSGVENRDNVCYFSEGLNIIIDYFRDDNEPLLILSEDHFFTLGITLMELSFNRFTLAYAPWDEELDANASILCVVPSAVQHLFPIPEHGLPVERHLKEYLITKLLPEERFKLNTRKHSNYFGDGVYTNSSKEMEEWLTKANII